MSGLKVKMMHQNLKTIFFWSDHSKHLRHAFLDNAYLKALAALALTVGTELVHGMPCKQPLLEPQHYIQHCQEKFPR